jgi:hypothetical protein
MTGKWQAIPNEVGRVQEKIPAIFTTRQESAGDQLLQVIER